MKWSEFEETCQCTGGEQRSAHQNKGEEHWGMHQCRGGQWCSRKWSGGSQVWGWGQAQVWELLCRIREQDGGSVGVLRTQGSWRESAVVGRLKAWWWERGWQQSDDLGVALLVLGWWWLKAQCQLWSQQLAARTPGAVLPSSVRSCGVGRLK